MKPVKSLTLYSEALDQHGNELTIDQTKVGMFIVTAGTWILYRVYDGRRKPIMIGAPAKWQARADEVLEELGL